MENHPENFFERLKANPRPVVVDFWAPWCGPCRMIDPVLKKVGQEYDGRVDVWKVNADEQPDILRQLRIYGIPTLISFKAGDEIARQTGATHQQAIRSLFEAALSGEKPASPGIAPLDRLLRLAIAGVLFYLAYSNAFQGVAWVYLVLSGLAFFTAVYDRCPIWQAISPRLSKLFKR